MSVYISPIFGGKVGFEILNNPPDDLDVQYMVVISLLFIDVVFVK